MLQEVVQKQRIYAKDTQMVQIHLYVIPDVHFTYTKIIAA